MATVAEDAEREERDPSASDPREILSARSKTERRAREASSSMSKALERPEWVTLCDAAFALIGRNAMKYV